MEMPRQKSFLNLIYDSFMRINGPLVGLVALALAVLTFFLGPETKVSIGWLVLTVCVLGILMCVVLDAGYLAWQSTEQVLPTVRKTFAPPKSDPDAGIILVIDPSQLFGVDAMVSVYTDDDEYERLIGVGSVLTIQTNRLIQVGITFVEGTDPDVVKKLNANDSSLLKKLLVKPSVPSYVLQGNTNV